MIDQKDIDNIVATFQPEYASFVTSNFSQQAAAKLAEKHGLGQGQTNDLEDGIKLYLLAVFTLDDLKNYISELCGLPFAEADKMTMALLAALPQGFELLQSDAHQFLISLKQKDTGAAPPTETPIPTNPSAPPPAPRPVSEPAAAPTAEKTLPRMRTMAADMSQAQTAVDTTPTYSSTQAAILNDRKQEPPTFREPSEN